MTTILVNGVKSSSDAALNALAAPAQPKRRGRPQVLSEADQTKPRSVRLDDARWAKLKSLGRDWLEQAIDRAKPTAPRP